MPVKRTVKKSPVEKFNRSKERAKAFVLSVINENVKKTGARKAPVKKTGARKAPVNKTVARKAPVNKTVARKAPVKKTVARSTVCLEGYKISKSGSCVKDRKYNIYVNSVPSSQGPVYGPEPEGPMHGPHLPYFNPKDLIESDHVSFGLKGPRTETTRGIPSAPMFSSGIPSAPMYAPMQKVPEKTSAFAQAIAKARSLLKTSGNADLIKF